MFTKIEIGNFLIALSTTGLMALGVIPMSLPILIALAVMFLVIGVIGRYVDGIKDDAERLKKYEERLNESSPCSVSDSSSNECV